MGNTAGQGVEGAIRRGDHLAANERGLPVSEGDEAMIAAIYAALIFLFLMVVPGESEAECAWVLAYTTQDNCLRSQEMVMAELAKQKRRREGRYEYLCL